jgi:hypothetical protein
MLGDRAEAAAAPGKGSMGIAEQDLSSSAKFSKLDWPPTKLSIRPAATSRKPVREIASAGLAWRLQLQRRLHRRLHACRAGPHGGLRRHADAALIALPFTKCLGAGGEKCSTVPRCQHQWQASAGSKWRGGEERGRWHAMSSP